MERERTKMKNLVPIKAVIWKAAAGIVAAGVIGTGGFVLYDSYQKDTEYQPESGEISINISNEDIRFPGEEVLSDAENTDLMQKEESAENTLDSSKLREELSETAKENPVVRPNTGVIYGNRTAPLGTEDASLVQNELTNLVVDMEDIPQEEEVGTLPDVDIVIPDNRLPDNSNNDMNHGEAGNTGGQKPEATPAATQTPNNGNPGTGGSEAESTATPLPEQTAAPTGQPDASPRPTPAPRPTGKPTPVPTHTPDYVPEEPDRVPPQSDYDKWYTEYPSDGVEKEEHDITLEVHSAFQVNWDDNLKNQFYMGEAITKEKILYSIVAVAKEYDETMGMYLYYPVQAVGNPEVLWVKEDSYPKIAAAEGFQATICFKPYKDSDEVQEYETTIPVTKRKLLITSFVKDEILNSNIVADLFPEDNWTIQLSDYLEGMYGNTGEQIFVTELLKGWSTTSYGTPFYEYTVEEDQTGLLVLYPCKETVPLPAEYVVTIGNVYTTDVSTEDSYGDVVKGYMLTDYTKDEKNLAVPRYIHSVQFARDAAFDTLTIPDTVRCVARESYVFDEDTFEMTTYYLTVRDAYFVDENNPVYSAADGMLLRKDETEILSIPADKEILEIPAAVEKINFNRENKIREIRFKGTIVPEMDSSCLGQEEPVTLVVPKEAYLNWLQAYGSLLNDNLILKSESQDDQQYVYTEDGFVLSKDGSTLYRFPKTLTGWYTVPKEIKKIARDAMKQCDSIEGIWLRGENVVLEENSLTGQGLRYVLTEKACQIPQKALGERQDAVICSQGGIAEQNGFTYAYLQDGQKDSYGVLLDTPEDIIGFDSETAGFRAPIREIGSYAFENRTQLRYAKLGESVKVIGTGAFKGCNNMEWLYSASEDEITVQKDALYRGEWGSTLRFAVFNAAVGNIDSYFASDQMFYARYYNDVYWCPTGAQGYEVTGYTSQGYQEIFSSATEENGHYLLNPIPGTEEGYVLYGYDAAHQGRRVISVTTQIPDSTVISLKEDTKVIGRFAFFQCGLEEDELSEFTVSGLEKVQVLERSAFELAGLSGELSLEEIQEADRYAFWGCAALQKVTFGKELSQIGSMVFYYCSGLQTAVFTSAQPPRLSLVDEGYGFHFFDREEEDEETENDTPRLVLEGQAAGERKAYTDAWKYAALGYDGEPEGGLSQEENLKGINLVRSWFGLPALRDDVSGGDAETGGGQEGLPKENDQTGGKE